MAEPTLRRKFMYNDLKNNNNKFWQVELYEDERRMVTTYGRVGSSGASTEFYPADERTVLVKVHEKLKKGYTELDLLKPTIVPASTGSTVVDGLVHQFLTEMFDEAGTHIKGYLSVSVDQLSLNQIQRGKDQLDRIRTMSINTPSSPLSRQLIADEVEKFYNLIPTRLPSRIDMDYETRRFLVNLSEHENRLDQLEAAVKGYVIHQAGSTTLLAQLGDVEVETLDKADPVYQSISKHFIDTTLPNIQYGQRRHRGIKHIFSVNIKPEREAFQKNTFGTSRVATLYHGTRSHNVRHILSTGLIVPRNAANGRRCGDGIYFGDLAQKAMQYSGGSKYPYNVIFVTEVALGKSYATPGYYSGSKAPAGYESVHGTNSNGGMDEFVVFNREQQTIRAVIVADSY